MPSICGSSGLLHQDSGLCRIYSTRSGPFADTIKMAQLGKLDKLYKIFDFVWQIEEEHHLLSPAKKAAVLFTMPLSYLYISEEQLLEFLVHVPLTQSEQILDMNELFPFLMTMTNDQSRVAVPKTGPHNVITNNRQRESQTQPLNHRASCLLSPSQSSQLCSPAGNIGLKPAFLPSTPRIKKDPLLRLPAGRQKSLQTTSNFFIYTNQD